MKQVNQSLVLASSSKYRRDQLIQLGLEFAQISPNINEAPLEFELPSDTALRLAEAKCRAVFAADAADAADVVIGSDQVCSFAGQQYGKPVTIENAVEQLQTFSGNCIEFFTAVCVMTAGGKVFKHCDSTKVRFRALNPQEIARYVSKDQPLDCAGSFKMESLGLSLFTAVESQDPSALLGLPLITLCEFLRAIELELP